MKLGEQMKVHVLASGSKGNMTLISSSDGWIALDVGLSKKLILEKLSKLKVTVNQIKHIVITHEHSDHTKGLKFLIDSNSDVNVYMSTSTCRSLIHIMCILLYIRGWGVSPTGKSVRCVACVRAGEAKPREV